MDKMKRVKTHRTSVIRLISHYGDVDFHGVFNAGLDAPLEIE